MRSSERTFWKRKGRRTFSGLSPKKTTRLDLKPGGPMRPVTVREILTHKERLGITEMIEPPGACASVRHLFRYAGSEPGRDVTPLPHTMFILPPTWLYAT